MQTFRIIILVALIAVTSLMAKADGIAGIPAAQNGTDDIMPGD